MRVGVVSVVERSVEMWVWCGHLVDAEVHGLLGDVLQRPQAAVQRRLGAQFALQLRRHDELGARRQRRCTQHIHHLTPLCTSPPMQCGAEDRTLLTRTAFLEEYFQLVLKRLCVLTISRTHFVTNLPPTAVLIYTKVNCFTQGLSITLILRVKSHIY